MSKNNYQFSQEINIKIISENIQKTFKMTSESDKNKTKQI